MTVFFSFTSTGAAEEVRGRAAQVREGPLLGAEGEGRVAPAGQERQARPHQQDRRAEEEANPGKS